MTLYEITDQYAALYAVSVNPEATDEEWKDAVLALEGLQESFEAKADGYARVMLNIRAEADALDAEIRRLTEMKRMRTKAADRMMDRMYDAMKGMERDSVKGLVGCWRFAKNPPSVDVLDEAAIPQEYRIPQPDTLDRKKILAALKAGQTVDGAALKQGEGIRFR